MFVIHRGGSAKEAMICDVLVDSPIHKMYALKKLSASVAPFLEPAKNNKNGLKQHQNIPKFIYFTHDRL
jgi:hypothetical protein